MGRPKQYKLIDPEGNLRIFNSIAEAKTIPVANKDLGRFLKGKRGMYHGWINLKSKSIKKHQVVTIINVKTKERKTFHGRGFYKYAKETGIMVYSRLSMLINGKTLSTNDWMREDVYNRIYKYT